MSISHPVPDRAAIAATLRAHAPEVLDQAQAMPEGWQVVVELDRFGNWGGIIRVLRLRTLPPHPSSRTVEISFRAGPHVGQGDVLAAILHWEEGSPLYRQAPPGRTGSMGQQDSNRLTAHRV